MRSPNGSIDTTHAPPPCNFTIFLQEKNCVIIGFYKCANYFGRCASYIVPLALYRWQKEPHFIRKIIQNNYNVKNH
jgi:hypothetical protein